jgi:hypothetical protein
MPVKVKTNLKSVLKVTDDVRKRFKSNLSSGSIGYELVRTIQDLVRKGISPVEGQGRFKRYSDSYRKAIKNKWIDKRRISPADLYLTGEMLGSLEIKENQRSVSLIFTDKKARYHQDGTDKMPMRRLLPEKISEVFTKRITQLILKALKLSLRRK